MTIGQWQDKVLQELGLTSPLDRHLARIAAGSIWRSIQTSRPDRILDAEALGSVLVGLSTVDFSGSDVHSLLTRFAGEPVVTVRASRRPGVDLLCTTWSGEGWSVETISTLKPE